MRALVARTGGLGDCILTLPVLSHIRRMYPDVGVDILGNAAMREISALTGIPDRLHNIDNPLFLPLYTGSVTPEFSSFIGMYDRVYVFTVADRSLVKQCVVQAGARHCIVLDPKPLSKHGRHITRHLMTICGETAKTDGAIVLPLPQVSGGTKRNGLLIHPGSGSTSKNWPPERFRAVMDAWEGDCTVILGPAERERGLAGAFTGVDVVCPETIEELCRIMMTALLYLGNDSGVSHCAAWCRIPGVVLFGATDPEIWRPVFDMTVVIRSNTGKIEDIGVGEVVSSLRRCAGSV